VSKCIATLKACQGAGERQDYAFNLTREFANLWEADAPYASSDKVRPNSLPGTGFEYSSSGGVSNGAAEPAWPATGTVVDGSITWTTGAITNDSLRHRIVSVEWSSDSDVPTSDQVETDDPALQEVRIWVGPGGTVGETYLIEGEITTDQDAIYTVRIELTIV
jgi:hypothetical protein